MGRGLLYHNTHEHGLMWHDHVECCKYFYFYFAIQQNNVVCYDVCKQNRFELMCEISFN